MINDFKFEVLFTKFLRRMPILCVARKPTVGSLVTTNREHNHPIKPDPFSYIIHQSHQFGHDKAVEFARGLWGNCRKAKKEPKLGRYTKLIWLLFVHILLLHRDHFLHLQEFQISGHPFMLCLLLLIRTWT